MVGSYVLVYSILISRSAVLSHRIKVLDHVWIYVSIYSVVSATSFQVMNITICDILT